MENEELKVLLQQGIAAARAGQQEQARALLLRVIALDEKVEAAWLWLSGLLDDPEERQICLENVLALDPDNKAAMSGLRWLKEQEPALPPEQPPPSPAWQSEAPRPVLSPAPVAPPPPAGPPPVVPQSPQGARPVLAPVEIEPYGCPFCGGSIGDDDLYCNHCQRSVALRRRKREGGTNLIWLVLFFLLLGFVSGLEGNFVSQLAQVSRLPDWLTHTAVKLLVGSALFNPEGVGALAEFVGAAVIVNYVLAGLCALVAVGLAFKSRAVYFASFLLAGVMVSVTLAGLLTQLTGWLPTIFRLGLIAITIKGLVEAAPAFEWMSQFYNADLDEGLKTDLDYHNRAQIYYDQEMWAKAAAHWQVASRLAPGQVQYRAELANAYLRMGYRAAALAEADRALAQAPEDEELRVFRNTLAQLEAEP